LTAAGRVESMSDTDFDREEAAMRRKISWRELNPVQRAATVILAVVQLALAVTAWRDLAQRSDAEVNGDRRLWALVIAINWIGPVLYFRRGRRAA
jgi:hypothetical protein